MKKSLFLRRFLIILLAAATCLFLPAVGSAHVQQGQATSFFTGISHPWSGMDHILAMVAVGLWGAQLGNPALWVLPVSFPMMMAVGAMMGLLGIPVPGIEIGIAVSALVLGVMILGEVRPPLMVSVVIVGFFAIFHGYAHGTELPPGQSGLLYSMGFVIGTGCLHGVGIAIGFIYRWPSGRLVLRATGAFIGLMGTFFLWQAIV